MDFFISLINEGFEFCNFFKKRRTKEIPLLFCCMSSLRKAPAACGTEEIRSRAFTVALLAVAMKRGFLDTN